MFHGAPLHALWSMDSYAPFPNPHFPVSSATSVMPFGTPPKARRTHPSSSWPIHLYILYWLRPLSLTRIQVTIFFLSRSRSTFFSRKIPVSRLVKIYLEEISSLPLLLHLSSPPRSILRSSTEGKSGLYILKTFS